MLTDEHLSELLELTADSFDVPELGIDRVLAAVEPPAESPVFTQIHRRRRFKLAAASFGAATFVAALVASVVLFGGSDNGSSSDSSGFASGSVALPSGAQGQQRAAAGESKSAASSNPVPSNPANAAGAVGSSAGATPRVVQTGSAQLQVRTGQVQPAVAKLTALAGQLGGLVAASNINADSSPGGSANATLTLRVPVAQWSTLQSRLPGIGKVVSSSSSAKDVSGQYVDLVARLNALHIQLDTYETIQSKATTTGDIVSVQQQIDGVQSQIEQLEGERQLLANQSDLATLDVTLSEQGAAVTAPPTSNDSGLGGAVHRAWQHFTSGIEWVVAASGTVALILIAVTVIGVGGRLGYRLVRRRLV